MIRKILIANRGEIACRIIRTCHEMGIMAVAIYSDADSNALHVALADEAVYIGASNASESYLNGQAIIDAALRINADAIHPGYGFLAENATFAYHVKASNLVWIGPPPETIEAMGDKGIAKMILQDVPFVPGYFDENQDNMHLVEVAEEIGYPIMVKATAGGGGKGMRLVTDAASMPQALEAARREASQAFGNDTLMLEKALVNPRHIEVQLFGDQYGNIITLGERECSIQRRHQKIVEETPSTALTPAIRRRLYDVAINIGQQLGYYNAGTIEFLLDGDNNFYFMEMNTRLQVEHPVTEALYDVDLVRWQIEVARGSDLRDLHISPSGLDVYRETPKGHAIEVRIYAEDPQNQFLPSTGDVHLWDPPSSVRVDSGIRTGDTISTHYDPMIAKIISVAPTRLEAIRKLDYALSQTTLHGMKHNIDFLRRILMSDDHLGGIISTQFLEHNDATWRHDFALDHSALIAVVIAKTHQHGTQYWRNNINRPIQHQFEHHGIRYDIDLSTQGDVIHVTLDGKTYRVIVNQLDLPILVTTIDGYRQTFYISEGIDDMWWVKSIRGHQHYQWQSPLPLPTTSKQSEGSLLAPMPGQIIQVLIETGQKVGQGDALMLLEAMKMEHRIEAPYDGTVTDIYYYEGDSVKADAVLLDIDPGKHEP